MEFKKYMHIERFGNDEVDGIELGKVYVFPKIDGTNSSIWLDGNEIKAGSRNRELSINNDNQGFFQYVLDSIQIEDFLKKHNDLRLFGEWLVPHTLKTYSDNAWRKFYIFDVCKDVGDNVEYLSYDKYKPLLDEFGLDYIPCIKIMTNAKRENFINELNNNIFLIKDGCGVGEGIVLKNYDFYNKYGRQVWAKIVTSEFKEKHYKEMGSPETNFKTLFEEEIIDISKLTSIINKIYSNIVNENNGWKSQYIPKLLNTVYHDFVVEEIWDIVKKNKFPKIDFKLLQHFVINRIKEIKSDLF